MSDSSRYGSGQLLIAFLVGAAAGAAVALLTAPRSGRETRENLKDWAVDLRERTGRAPHAVREAFSKAAEAAKSAFMEELRKSEPGEKAG